MKLYLISQEENNDYDTYDSVVVCAPNEEFARQWVPTCDSGTSGRWRSEGDWSSWCSSPDKVTVKYLGKAEPGIAVGVVCASFNAG